MMSANGSPVNAAEREAEAGGDEGAAFYGAVFEAPAGAGECAAESD